MGIELRFDDADWARIERDYTAWWAHELERPLVQVTGTESAPGVYYPDVHGFYANYGLDRPVEGILLELTPYLEARRFYGDAFPHHFVNFGPGIMAGFLGCRVYSVPETVWFEPSQETALEALAFPSEAPSPWWQRVGDWTRAAVELWEGKVQISHTDLGGNLDILASFRTTQGLLYDLYDAPERVEGLAQELTRLWLGYYDELDALIHPHCRGRVPWAPIWSAETCYMLQCDFAYMISPAMFERFVLPDLTACCDHLEHGFYHLDGPGQIVHLDLLLEMPRLRGVQWVPGSGSPPPEEWPAVLKRIIEAGKLCQIYVTAQGALSIVKNLGGKGFMLSVSDDLSPDEARAFLREVAAADLSHKRLF